MKYLRKLNNRFDSMSDGKKLLAYVLVMAFWLLFLFLIAGKGEQLKFGR